MIINIKFILSVPIRTILRNNYIQIPIQQLQIEIINFNVVQNQKVVERKQESLDPCRGQAIKEFDKHSWQQMDSNIIRTSRQKSLIMCIKMEKNQARIKQQQSRRPWTKEEDDLLISLHDQYGTNWKKITEYFVDRSSKSLRERHVNHLATKINKQSFSKEEDDHIYNRFLELGPKWALISKELQNRSENQVKNRFHYQIKSTYLNDKHSYYKISSLVDKTKAQYPITDDPYPQTFQCENSSNNFYSDNEFESIWQSNWIDKDQYHMIYIYLLTLKYDYYNQQYLSYCLEMDQISNKYKQILNKSLN
ncbi:hypothetical protein pb186bvf_007874 [Paramecium bursaria]